MSKICAPLHDWFNATLTFGLCCGLVISYAPQHYRIIQKGSSEGLSPWFLLLGSTSSAAGFLNMVTMQWRIVKCCQVLSLGSCIEMTAGVVQVGLQWILFTAVFVLYMMYYPSYFKYSDVDLDPHDMRPQLRSKTPSKSEEWHLSVALAWSTIIHLLFISITTFFLLLINPVSSAPDAPLPPQVSVWATFLGVSSAILSATQYAPQLIHTYNTKLVGALSIPMMCIQSPGAIFMVTSIALRPGTNWTSWITFAVAGLMQGSLLVMCIIWTYRQRQLGIDDFGHPLDLSSLPDPRLSNGDDIVPGPVTIGENDPDTALAASHDRAMETNVRGVGKSVGEGTPLIRKTRKIAGSNGAGPKLFGL